MSRYQSKGTYGMPRDGFGDSAFRGRAGVVIEVAPRQFASFVIAGTVAEVEITTEVEPIYDTLLSQIHVPTTREVHMVLHGYLSSQDDQAARPDWYTEPAGEIGHRRAIGDGR